MEDLKSKTVKELADRLNAIMVARNQLDLEYNKVVLELWERIPSLKGNANLELKEVREMQGEEKTDESHSFKR